MINSQTHLFCVIGHPVSQSLSPLMHNAAFQKLELNHVFLAFDVSDLKGFINSARLLNIKGMSVTIPHKIEVMKNLDSIDETAQKIGAVNTIINQNHKFIGTNTDWLGAIKALEEKIAVSGKNIAVIGAGGAARAIIYGLNTQKAKIYVFNRNYDTGQKLSDEFGLSGAYPLSEFMKSSKQLNFDIIINTTSVGMSPDDKNSPVPIQSIRKNQIVFDIVFKPSQTRLLHDAKSQGASIVYGYKMLLYQAEEQFKLFTGHNAPINVMEKAILKALSLQGYSV